MVGWYRISDTCVQQKHSPARFRRLSAQERRTGSDGKQTSCGLRRAGREPGTFAQMQGRRNQNSGQARKLAHPDPVDEQVELVLFLGGRVRRAVAAARTRRTAGPKQPRIAPPLTSTSLNASGQPRSHTNQAKVRWLRQQFGRTHLSPEAAPAPPLPPPLEEAAARNSGSQLYSCCRSNHEVK
jgi:hypothetical protein